MQISRHWRLNAQRYRLQGVRYENGETSLQNRPRPPSANFAGKEAEPTGSNPDSEAVISTTEVDSQIVLAIVNPAA